jgi:hypothetical protein
VINLRGKRDLPGEGVRMECATHPEKISVGYCKKCGKFGCDECLIKVSLTGPVGKKYTATDVLFCRECLNKARPDLAIPKSDQKLLKKPLKPARPARARGIRIRVGKGVAVAAIAVAAVVGIAAALMLLPQSTDEIPQPTMPADEFASRALEALSLGDHEAFLSCVDVREFMCRMDETGLTRRDYQEADREKIAELIALHYEYLADVLCAPANTRRKFTLVSSKVSQDSASIQVKPWIAFGRKSYRRILLKNKMGQWQIAGLAAPDF